MFRKTTYRGVTEKGKKVESTESKRSVFVGDKAITEKGLKKAMARIELANRADPGVVKKAKSKDEKSKPPKGSSPK